MAKKKSHNDWIDIFQDLQEKELGTDYGHAWSLQFQYDLVNKLTPEQHKEGWKSFQLNCSGRYVCSWCCYVWKSGLIPHIFHYRFTKSTRGLVRLHMCREQCRRCKCPNLEKPITEINKIRENLTTLIMKIRKDCYNEDIEILKEDPRICPPSQPTETGRQKSSNIWIEIFQDLLKVELGKDHRWVLQFQYNLVDKLTPEQQEEGWKILQINTFGRFICSRCSSVWKSGQIHLLFHYRSIKANRGLVRLNICKDQCKSCTFLNLERPTLEEDKIKESLKALIMNIKKIVYNENLKPQTSKPIKDGTIPSSSTQVADIERIKFKNVWMDTFMDMQETELRLIFGHVWSLNFRYDLMDTLKHEQEQEGWKICYLNSFGSFICSKCSNKWKSGVITLIFHYCLKKSKRGLVLLRIYRQQCRRCKHPILERPSIEENEIKGNLKTLIMRIRKNCYNDKEYIKKSPLEPPRHGPALIKPHERDLCEACLLGICSKSS